MDWIINKSENSNIQEIVVANKDKIKVLCSGDVNIQTFANNKTYDVTVKNVLCVPELTTNLLSVSQLITNGNNVSFKENCCKIFNNQNELVAIAYLIDGVYKLETKKVNKCFLTVDGITWHRRFGHMNSSDLNKMKNNLLVDGLLYSGELKTTKQNCVVCCEAKQTRLPFSQKGSRASSILELVHADLCGPMEVVSIGGSRYFLILEDDFSRMAFIYFLKNKDETFEIFKEFKLMVENQTNLKIKKFRSDNGGEFCSRNFDNFLKKCGIIHQKTNAYTPEQNGSSERLNRSVVEKAKCLLFDAGLETKFWAEACNTAVYLKNRSFATGLNKTPFEVWTGSRPNVSCLRIFGSSVMVHIPKAKRQKWDKKSEKMIFVGYSDNIKGYRVYNPRTNCISTSRDVIIMEETKEEIRENKKDTVDIIITHETELETESTDSVGEHLSESSENNSEDFDEAEEFLEAEVQAEVRKSERISKPNSKFQDYEVYLCAGAAGSSKDMYDEPTTYSEALSRPDNQCWVQAISEELQSFSQNDAWELADAPAGATIVPCKWVFKTKCDGENLVRYRARLVAKGFAQKPGIDFCDTFSPVVKHSTLRVLLSLAVNLNLDITHLDVKTAFLNGYLCENVYMTKPEGFEVTNNNKNKVLKLKKAIYGLKQASRAWYQRVEEVLSNLNYKKSDFEPCLFIKSKSNKNITIVALYVDDFFLFSNDIREVEYLKKELSLKFEIKDLGQAKQVLGMRISYDKNKGEIRLDQEQYIDQLLRKFNLLESKTASTPMEVNLKLDRADQNCLNQEIPYQKLIGSLMYLCVLTRPDISFAVSFMSQYNNCFDNEHWNYAKRILKYLKGTKHYCMTFNRSVNFNLTGFVDADWANNVLDRKSYTGFCFKLGNCLISWESRKQNTVALSSTEAEYMALSEASKEAMYLRNLICELTGDLKCITIFNDNQSAIKLSANPVFNKRSKHIDVRHHFVREAVASGFISVKYLQTTQMPADILTKSLCSAKHLKFLHDLCIRSGNSIST